MEAVSRSIEPLQNGVKFRLEEEKTWSQTAEAGSINWLPHKAEKGRALQWIFWILYQTCFELNMRAEDLSEWNF